MMLTSCPLILFILRNMKKLEQDVAKRYHEYTDAFIGAGKSKDVALLRPFTYLPLSTIVGGRVYVVDAEEKSDKRWSRILAGLPEEYDHSIIHSLDITVMSSTSAFVCADVSRFKEGGDEYDRFWASYIMVNTEEDWKITTWIVHDSKEAPRTVRL